MKKSDIAVLILLVSVSLVIGYFVGSWVFSANEIKEVPVQTAEPIVAEITPPDAKVFNDEGINPTVQVTIGQSANTKPFNSN